MPVVGFLVAHGLVLLASLTLVTRFHLRHPLERFAAAGIVWAACVVVPMYPLGLLGLASRPALVALPVLLALTILLTHRRYIVACYTTGHLRSWLRHWLRALARANGIAVSLVVGCVVLWLWLLLTTYLAPAHRAYDSPWYHEPLVALFLQHVGFQHVQLPESMAYINGIPRAAELLSVWFVVLSDRRLLELPSVLAAPVFWALAYLFVRTVIHRRDWAAAWVSLIVFMPAVVVYLQSTYVDLIAHTFLLGALYWGLATRPHPGRCLLAVICLAFAVGVKQYCWLPGLVIALLGARRLAWGFWRADWPRRWLLIGSALLVLPVAVTFPVRNWVLYANPLYPVEVRLAHGALHWPGPLTADRLQEIVDPPGVLWHDWTAAPQAYPPQYPHHVDVHTPQERAPAFNYGYAFPWVLLPCILFGLLVLLGRLLRKRADTPRLLWQALIVILAFHAAFPLHRLARYYACTFVVMVAVGSWALVHLRWWPLGYTLLGAALCATCLTYVWQSPRILYAWHELAALYALPAPLREVSAGHGAPALDEVGALRERELSAGTVVVACYDVQESGALWNNAYTNVVRYLDDVALLAAVQTGQAVWAVCASHRTDLARAIHAFTTPLGALVQAPSGATYDAYRIRPLSP